MINSFLILSTLVGGCSLSDTIYSFDMEYKKGYRRIEMALEDINHPPNTDTIVVYQNDVTKVYTVVFFDNACAISSEIYLPERFMINE